MVTRGGGSVEQLAALAGRVDRALQVHDRPAAAASAERHLDALFRHQQAPRSIRPRRDPASPDVLDLETSTMIAATALTIGTLLDTNRWPPPLLHHDVEESIPIEAERFAPRLPTARE